MNIEKKIEHLLSQFRGIHIMDITHSEDNSWEICFNAYCQDALKILMFCENNCPFFTTVGCYDYKNLEYTIIIEDKYILNFIEAVESCNRYDVFEDIDQIEGYERLDNDSLEKYLNFVKYIRSMYEDGRSEETADEILYKERLCLMCQKPTYSKDDEIRAILEFDSAEKAYAVLTENYCEDEDEHDQEFK